MTDKSVSERIGLIVDDEASILPSSQRVFHGKGYKILKVNNGSDAIEIIKNSKVQVILSDQRMPEITGVELLSEVKPSHPDIVQIVLSGYADLKSILDSINSEKFFIFIIKLWEEERLLNNIPDGFSLHKMKQENERLTSELKITNANLEIDNFGTDYSSFGDLKKLPIDILKPDISFVRDIHTDSDSYAIGSVLIEPGDNLDMKVITDDVDNIYQLKIAEEKECDVTQEYFFSKPVPAGEMKNFIGKYEKFIAERNRLAGNPHGR